LFRRSALVVALVAASLSTATTMAGAAAVSEEAEFVTAINTSRTAAGLAPLADHWDLVDDARRHTAEMMAATSLFHSTTDQLTAVTTGWTLIGENVGRGPDPARLHEAFMNSPTHRDNVLGDYSYVGVGADRSSDGTLFVTVLFMQAPPQWTTFTHPVGVAVPASVDVAPPQPVAVLAETRVAPPQTAAVARRAFSFACVVESVLPCPF